MKLGYALYSGTCYPCIVSPFCDSLLYHVDLIPSVVCDEVDKLYCQLIWGSSDSSRKLALVSWEQIQQPKEYGGLGFRSSRLTNQAFMMKLA